MSELSVLVVEDSIDDTELVLRELTRAGYTLFSHRVETPDEMTKALNAREWDIIIADYNLPRFSAPDALKLLRACDLDLPFIVVSGSIGEETAVAAMKAGANDYIMKDNLVRLVPAVERELREAKDRAARRRADETVRHLAYHDVLTGIPNRILLYDRLTQAINVADRDNHSTALLYMDLDHFKEINDTLGHQYGDQLLQQATSRLQHCLRHSDTIARMGGDEFAIVLPSTNLDRAISTVKKLMACFKDPFQLNNCSLSVSASIGIALYPVHGMDADILVQHADVAMYMAKRNHWGHCVYQPSLDHHSLNRLALVEELRKAIPAQQLIPYYQLKMDLRSQEICGAEALVRWQHPEQGLIEPDNFVPLAEYFGLITPLTHSVLDSVLKQMNELQDHWKISVNLSTRALNDPQFEESVIQRLNVSGVDPSNLEFEITESAMMSNPSRTMALLISLAKRGVQFSIDDFGTGFSSLGYLKHLPINTIKIDKSFVSNMIGDQSDTEIVRAIIALAHNLGLKVVAEGVENRDTLERLTSLDCDIAQGYFISYPRPANEVLNRAAFTFPVVSH